MPPRNNPLPAAVRLFNCAICDKGYPRQLDYENHLRSYDHNHRQRLADMKRITANNDPESAKPKQGLDMRSISVEEANKMPGVGGRFKKVGGTVAGAAAGGGSRFKKVGVAVSGAKKESEVAKKEEEIVEKVEEKVQDVPMEVEQVVTEPEQVVKRPDEDTIMADGDEEEEVTWEEYDFTKPTGCDHANCGGCKTDGIWSGTWVQVGTV